jgi:hypothetical protein
VSAAQVVYLAVDPDQSWGAAVRWVRHTQQTKEGFDEFFKGNVGWCLQTISIVNDSSRCGALVNCHVPRAAAGRRIARGDGILRAITASLFTPQLQGAGPYGAVDSRRVGFGRRHGRHDNVNADDDESNNIKNQEDAWYAQCPAPSLFGTNDAH